MLDWRSYFRTADSDPLSIEKAAPQNVEKAGGDWDEDLHPRDANGRFAPKGAGGEVPSRSNPSGIKQPFSTLDKNKKEEIVKRAILSAAKTKDGKDLRAMSAASLMFHVSQATGQHPTKEFSMAVGKTVEDLARRGEVKVQLEERTKRYGPNATYEGRSIAGKAVLKPEGQRVYKTDAAGNKVLDYDASTQKVPVYSLLVTEKGRMHESKGTFTELKGYNLQHSGDISRPVKYDIPPDSVHGQMLALRRETYPDSKTAVMGRFFSTHPNAPENTHGKTEKDVAKLEASTKEARLLLKEAKKSGDEKAIAKAEAKYKAAKHKSDVARGIMASDKVSRHEQYDKKGMQFYDATSSVNGIIGTMTGNKQMLQNSRLQMFGKDQHQFGKVLEKAGINPDNAHKPYFANLLQDAMGNAMKPKDFEGIGSAFNHDKERTAEALKKASKAIFTPGTYGSNIHAAVWGEHTADPGRLASGGADNAAKILQTSGMTKELANKAAAQMAENFRSSPLYQFNSAFKGIMKHAPEGFVYTNPLSGFHMNFDKFKTTEAKISVNPKTGKEYKSRQTLQNSIRMPVVDKTSGKPVEGVKQVAFPYARAERDSRGSASGAAALFIQNWDSAIMSKLGTDLKSPHTLHDAIAVPKGKEQKAALAKAVANAYNRTAKIDPIGNLVNQIKDTLKHRERLSAPKGSKPSKAYLKKIAALDAALKHFRSLSQQKPSASTGHNLAGINVPSDNAHFVEE